MEYKRLDELQIEIIDGDRGKNYPNGDDFKKDKYCLFLNAKNVTINGFNFSETMFIDKDKDNILRKGKLKRDDIVLTTRGTVGNVAYYSSDITYENVRINSGMVILRCDKNSILPEYLYYVLKSNFLQKQINNIKSGSAQPQLPISTLKNLKINFLNIVLQKKVIKILNEIDKKIKLNNQINDNLHKLIKNIYSDTFINNKNTHWEKERLGNYLTVERGLSYKGKYLAESGTPMINLGNVMPDGVFRLEKNKYYTGEYKEKVTANVGDIVVANTDMTQNREVIGTPVIIPSLYEGKVIFSHHIYGLKNLKLPKMYVFYSLLTDEWNGIAGGSATGTTVLALPKDAIEEYLIYIPDNATLDKFETLAENIQKKREQILLENIKLEQLRDTLLPKLMNEEIDLDKIEI